MVAERVDAPPPLPGGVLFARYAFPPNELGYCGPPDAARMLDHGAGVGPEVDIAERARSFDGAFPYLRLIADSAGVADPLDARVVEAYWVGNKLLDRVPRPAFDSLVRASFADQSGANWACLDVADTNLPPSAHHSFHVFTIYPWVRLLPVGGQTALDVLQRCRIRWGRVERVAGDTVQVRSRPITWDGQCLAVGPARAETARWSHEGRSLAPQVAEGDWVSLHWDWVCDRLSGRQVRALRRYTRRQLDLTNRSLGTG